MSTEIERKYLVAERGVIAHATEPPVAIRQAYLATGKTAVRVRIAGASAWLGVVGVRGGEPTGYEYKVPVPEAEEMIARLAVTPVVEKDRYRIDDEARWAIDVFKGDNTPLVIAEITHSSRVEKLPRPEWLGDDVSHDMRYQNVYLALHPYSSWKHEASRRREASRGRDG